MELQIEANYALGDFIILTNFILYNCQLRICDHYKEDFYNISLLKRKMKALRRYD